MIFIKNQEKSKIHTYAKYLKALGSFSNLYSSSNKPFIQYRVAENIFCKAFNAENLARADVAYDAIIDGFGVGIKTFILSGNSKIEKIAEFNSLSSELRQFKGKKLALELAKYRNERILFADRIYNTDKRIYHIIGRDDFIIKVFEVTYDLIDIDSIEIISDTKSSLKFKDKNNEYNFNHSKSVLMKRFIIPDNYIEIDVEIIENPIEVLLNLNNSQLDKNKKSTISTINSFSEEEELIPGVDFVVLPLYSPSRKKSNTEPIVPLSSQLNQWNASGRKRDSGEVYIPIPKTIHNLSPDFFPNRDVIFDLEVPSGEIFKAKVCQDGSKALMTNPNNAMAEWILRKVLKLKEREVLKYEQLKKVGYDCVKITKKENGKYFIDFMTLGGYEQFIDNY